MTRPAAMCAAVGCGQPALVRAATPYIKIAGGHFIVFREINCADQSTGMPLCLDCAHLNLDGMVAATMPKLKAEDVPWPERMDLNP